MASAAEERALETGDPDGVLSGELEIVGRIAGSSNYALLVSLAEQGGRHAIYKPIRTERPLWDFPEGTLAGREAAARVVSEVGGWALVPPTIVRDGPLGLGSVQLWIGDPFGGDDGDGDGGGDGDGPRDAGGEPVDRRAPGSGGPGGQGAVVAVVPLGDATPGWHHVFDGETPEGAGVSVVHADVADIRSLAVFDAVVNNADRKGSHCVRDATGRLWAIDHGVTFSPEPKLRTVLWGWAGVPIPDAEIARLEQLASVLGASEWRRVLELLLPTADVAALERRVAQLLRRRVHPRPSGDWPAVPWPPL